MAYIANVEDGKVTSSYTKTELDGSIKKKISDSKTPGGELDKEAFLQLLVAQMQYQDPLEPTDNTEYISQLASFSSLEQMQNMSASMANMSTAADLQRATALIGNYVTVDYQGSDVSGKVDSVEIKEGEAFLSINGTSYPLSSLKEAVDSEYLEASLLSAQFTQAVKSLPSLEALTTTEAPIVENIRRVYDTLNDYQKSYISQSDLMTFKTYEEKMAELLAKEKETSSNNEDAKEESDETEA
ncbi:MAG: flagellar hook capping FlgD N-terminal domain-containing protein [Lachnospiraceae bacterium]|nr:flagellar hook capping FlgD N-terminal domain-containing protein [Lachnospiraceae bacterium]